MRDQAKESKVDFSDLLMGPDGPLYWICAGFLALFACTLLFGLLDWERRVMWESKCKEWVGAEYVYDDPHCYRMIDGKLQYVDFDREQAVKEYEERGRTE